MSSNGQGGRESCGMCLHHRYARKEQPGGANCAPLVRTRRTLFTSQSNQSRGQGAASSNDRQLQIHSSKVVRHRRFVWLFHSPDATEGVRETIAVAEWTPACAHSGDSLETRSRVRAEYILDNDVTPCIDPGRECIDAPHGTFCRRKPAADVVLDIATEHDRSTSHQRSVDDAQRYNAAGDAMVGTSMQCIGNGRPDGYRADATDWRGLLQRRSDGARIHGAREWRALCVDGRRGRGQHESQSEQRA